MSALFLRRRQRYEIAHDWAPCDNRCFAYGSTGESHRGWRCATWEVELLGRHAAWLCDRCVSVWRSGWPGAGGCEPVVDGRWGAAVEEAQAA